MIRQLTDGENNDDDEYHPSDVLQSAHALYARFLLVPVQRPHAVNEQHVEDCYSDERYEQTYDQGGVSPRLTIPNTRPYQLTRRLYRRHQLSAHARPFWVKVIVWVKVIFVICTRVKLKVNFVIWVKATVRDKVNVVGKKS